MIIHISLILKNIFQNNFNIILKVKSIKDMEFSMGVLIA